MGLPKAEATKFGVDHVRLVGINLDTHRRFYPELFGPRHSGARCTWRMRLGGINLFIRSPRPAERVSADVVQHDALVEA